MYIKLRCCKILLLHNNNISNLYSGHNIKEMLGIKTIYIHIAPLLENF